jgi:hypothetical protein
MTDRGPIQVVAALEADQPGHVLGEHGLEHLQARPDRQGEQALTGGTGQLGHRDGHPLGQLQLSLVGGGGAVGILRHGGPLLVERLGRCPTPTTRQVTGRGPPPQLLREPGQPLDQRLATTGQAFGRTFALRRLLRRIHAWSMEPPGRDKREDPHP